MWYFLGVRLVKGELLAVKVKSNFKKKMKNDYTLTANNFALKTPPGKNYHIFGNLRTSVFQWWYPGYGIVFENFE